MVEFHTEKDESFGCIPLREHEGVWEVLQVEHARGGHLKPPKGHRELNESPEDAAKRELYEETGIQNCRLVAEPTFHEHYSYPHAGGMIEKMVVYYLCYPEGDTDAAPRAGDVTRCIWLSLEQAIEQATFLETKKMLEEVEAYLQKTH